MGEIKRFIAPVAIRAASAVVWWVGWITAQMRTFYQAYKR